MAQSGDPRGVGEWGSGDGAEGGTELCRGVSSQKILRSRDQSSVDSEPASASLGILAFCFLALLNTADSVSLYSIIDFLRSIPSNSTLFLLRDTRFLTEPGMRTERNGTEKRKRRRQSGTPRFLEDSRPSRSRIVSISKAKMAPALQETGRAMPTHGWKRDARVGGRGREEGARWPACSRYRYEEIAPRPVDGGGGEACTARAREHPHEKLHLFARRSVSAPKYYCF